MYTDIWVIYAGCLDKAILMVDRMYIIYGSILMG
jgi:hypothetical protein